MRRVWSCHSNPDAELSRHQVRLAYLILPSVLLCAVCLGSSYEQNRGMDHSAKPGHTAKATYAQVLNDYPGGGDDPTPTPSGYPGGDATPTPDPYSTPTPSPTPAIDALIAGADGYYYVGDHIYYPDVSEQTQTQTIVPTTTAIYYVKIKQPPVTVDPCAVSGPAGDNGWSIHYRNAGGSYYGDPPDITDQVTGDGWEPDFSNGDALIRVEVTPDAALTTGYFDFQVTVNGSVAVNGGDTLTVQEDAVRAVTLIGSDTNPTPTPTPSDGPTSTPEPPPHVDALIRNGDGTDTGADPAYLGDDIYNDDGAGQTVTQGVAPSTTASYSIKVQNDSSTATRITVTGDGDSDGDSDGWTVQYFDALQGGSDITQGITSEAGWTTPNELAPHAAVELLAVVTAGPGVVDGESKVVKVTTTAVADSNMKDTVVACTTLVRQLLRLEYSYDDGATWTAATHLSVTSVYVMAVEGRSLGIRVVKRHPDLPWPGDKEFPYIAPRWAVWQNGNFDNPDKNVGEELWLHYDRVQTLPFDWYNVDVYCGSEGLDTHFMVRPNYQIDLDAGPGSIVNGGGTDDEAKTTLTAHVTNWLGEPLSDVPVRFLTTHDDGTPAGDINLPGTADNGAVTDANGDAAVTLTSDALVGGIHALAEIDGGDVFYDPLYHNFAGEIWAKSDEEIVNVNPRYNINLSSDKGTLVAGGTDDASQATLTATVTDWQGNPASNVTVSFTSTAGTLSSSTATTNSDGNAQVTLTAGATAGDAQFVATINGPNAQVCSTADTIRVTFAPP